MPVFFVEKIKDQVKRYKRVRNMKIFFLSLPSFFVAKSYITALFNNNEDIYNISHKICNNIVKSFFVLEKQKQKDSKGNKNIYFTIERFKEYLKKTKKICHSLFKQQTKDLVKQNKNIFNFPTTITLSAWGTVFNITFYIIALAMGAPFAYATPIFIGVIGFLFIVCAIAGFFGRKFINNEVQKIHALNLDRIWNIKTDAELQQIHESIMQENEQSKARNCGDLSPEEIAIIEELNVTDRGGSSLENAKSLMGMQSLIQDKPVFDFSATLPQG